MNYFRVRHCVHRTMTMLSVISLLKQQYVNFTDSSKMIDVESVVIMEKRFLPAVP